jgi:hypothetical protein
MEYIYIYTWKCHNESPCVAVWNKQKCHFFFFYKIRERKEKGRKGADTHVLFFKDPGIVIFCDQSRSDSLTHHVKNVRKRTWCLGQLVAESVSLISDNVKYEGITQTIKSHSILTKEVQWPEVKHFEKHFISSRIYFNLFVFWKLDYFHNSLDVYVWKSNVFTSCFIFCIKRLYKCKLVLSL